MAKRAAITCFIVLAAFGIAGRLIFNLFGTGLAPLVVGFVTNYVIGSEAKVGHSIALTAAIMGPLALLILWSGLKPYARSVARAGAWG